MVIFFLEKRIDLISAKLNNNTNDDMSQNQYRKCTANIVLADFEFEIKSDLQTKNHSTTFYVLVISHSTDLFITEAVVPVGNKIEFNETFSFKNVNDSFCVKAEMLCITLKTEKKLLDTFFRKVKILLIIFFLKLSVDIFIMKLLKF